MSPSPQISPTPTPGAKYVPPAEQDSSKGPDSTAAQEPLSLAARLAALLIIAAFIALGLSVGIVNRNSYEAERAQERANKDPRVGPVLVFDNRRLFKRCDGATLVYYSDGWSRDGGPGPVENSAECR